MNPENHGRGEYPEALRSFAQPLSKNSRDVISLPKINNEKFVSGGEFAHKNDTLRRLQVTRIS
jgi:hypothetical protein